MNDVESFEGWISTKEASDVFGYSIEYIRQLARASKVTSMKVGDFQILINRKSLEEYKANKDKKTQVN